MGWNRSYLVVASMCSGPVARFAAVLALLWTMTQGFGCPTTPSPLQPDGAQQRDGDLVPDEDLSDSSILDTSVTDWETDDLVTDRADTSGDQGDPQPEVDREPLDEEDQTFVLLGSGTWDDPFVIDHFPFQDQRDTSLVDQQVVDGYSCAPDVDESGSEIVYRLAVPDKGILFASVGEPGDDDVDVDIHLLAGPHPEACLVRHHYEFYEIATPDDDLYLVVDTWVDSTGTEMAGPYTLDLDLEDLPSGICGLEWGSIELINREDPLPLPAIGEVVREAHLVTLEEFPEGWPTSSRDGIEAHYALSQGVSGYVMDRSGDWAPAGEGGCEYGQGSTSRPPVLDEAWYVNMYWRYRPAGGTRMLVFNPANRRAVVTSAGYETGPGSAERLGGACEEIHHYLSSTHRSRLLMGFLGDQGLPLGPIECP